MSQLHNSSTHYYVKIENCKLKIVAIFFVASFILLRASFAYAADSGELDTDGDGLSDYNEVTYFHTDPNYVDTDADGYADNTEIYSGYNPLGTGRASVSTKRVEVDLTTQTLTYFYNDFPLGSFGVSTGIPIWHTPTGTFKIFAKKPVVNYTGANYSYPKTKWNLEFLPHIYLHGAFWHNQFGIKPMSHGCVNIAYKDVEKLYGFLDIGNQVKVKGKTPKGKVTTQVAVN